jgi:alkylation response protein AidB-like acyl-CoA dehydrogenase
MPAIQQILADMKIGILTGRAAYIHAASLQDQGLPFSTESASAKVYCTETANKVCASAVQLHGGCGYVREYDVERYYRDVRVTTIYEGANQVQRMIVARNELYGREV